MWSDHATGASGTFLAFFPPQLLGLLCIQSCRVTPLTSSPFAVRYRLATYIRLFMQNGCNHCFRDEILTVSEPILRFPLVTFPPWLHVRGAAHIRAVDHSSFSKAGNSFYSSTRDSFEPMLSASGPDRLGQPPSMNVLCQYQPYRYAWRSELSSLIAPHGD